MLTEERYDRKQWVTKRLWRGKELIRRTFQHHINLNRRLKYFAFVQRELNEISKRERETRQHHRYRLYIYRHTKTNAHHHLTESLHWSPFQSLFLCKFILRIFFPVSTTALTTMADFDAIYEDVQDEEPIPPPNIPKLEPIIIRGTGNMTVYVWHFVIFVCGIFEIFAMRLSKL